jgi:hypothetical protein
LNGLIALLDHSAQERGGRMGVHSSFVHDLVTEEIRRIVAEAIARDSILSIAECVDAITKVHPITGLSKPENGDEVMISAARAGVAVEIGRRAEDTVA